MRIRLEFKPQDLWVGVFWKRPHDEPVCHCGDAKHGDGCGHPFTPIQVPDLLDIWICLVPCFPINITTLI